MHEPPPAPQPLAALGRTLDDHAADAEDASYEARRQELALGVVHAYFGAEAAEEGLRYAEDRLAQAEETERFARARNVPVLYLLAACRGRAAELQREGARAAAEASPGAQAA